MLDVIKRVPRIEDLPYYSSHPITFVYQSTATLTAGVYTWADTPTVCVNDRKLLANALYYMRTITMTADVGESDFLDNIVAMPNFTTYLKSKSNNPIFRDPIPMAGFLQNLEFRQVWNTTAVDDHVMCAFTGQLSQGAALIGKSSIQLTTIISAQEITDGEFIKIFTRPFPGENI